MRVIDDRNLVDKVDDAGERPVLENNAQRERVCPSQLSFYFVMAPDPGRPLPLSITFTSGRLCEGWHAAGRFFQQVALLQVLSTAKACRSLRDIRERPGPVSSSLGRKITTLALPSRIESTSPSHARGRSKKASPRVRGNLRKSRCHLIYLLRDKLAGGARGGGRGVFRFLALVPCCCAFCCC